MLNQFRPGELPGSDSEERYEETGVALLESAWYAALMVDLACLQYGRAGWNAMGRRWAGFVCIISSLVSLSSFVLRSSTRIAVS